MIEIKFVKNTSRNRSFKVWLHDSDNKRYVKGEALQKIRS